MAVVHDPNAPPGGLHATLLSGVLKKAGWFGNAARDAEGIVWAESSGDPMAVNPATCGANEHAVGLFQVCTVHCGSYGLPTDRTACSAKLKDPVTNARIAHLIYVRAGNTFARDWPETFNSDKFKQGRGRDMTLASGGGVQTHSADEANIDPMGTTGPAANAADSIVGQLVKVIGALFDPSTYLRLGKGLLGGVLIIVGTGALVFIITNRVSNTPTGRTVKKAAEAAAL